jgi:ABC-2 type transport system ATP-binding protein
MYCQDNYESGYGGMETNSIEISNLTKRYPDVTAVDNISFSIQEGEIFGLLGPNGAGKTTTLSMLSTITKPTSGTANVNGFDIKDETNVRKSIGIVFQDPSLDDELTGLENLEFHGRMYHMPANMRKERIAEVLALVGLQDAAHKKIKEYSGGMKRRLEIARGLMHHPKILFLDEPTLGLDPQTRRKIWNYIKNMNEKEKLTIILTTHYMEEADALCNRIGIIDHGKIIAIDTPDALKESIGGDIIALDTKEPRKLEEILKGNKNLKKIVVDDCDCKLYITAKNGGDNIPKILDVAEKNGIEITSVELTKPTLEDVFINYTGRVIREEEGSELDAMRLRSRLWSRR